MATSTTKSAAEFQASGKSVSIMKALATYQVALDNYGTMTLAEIMPYVIEGCQQGIRVTQNFKSLYDSSYSKLIKSEGSQEVWFKDGIIPYELDEVIYNEIRISITTSPSSRPSRRSPRKALSTSTPANWARRSSTPSRRMEA